MDLLQKTADVNKVALQKDKADVSSVSTESLIMSLLGQIQILEEERDNARLLAARMRERLEHVTTSPKSKVANSSSDSDTGSTTHDVNRSLAKLLREVSSNIVNDLQRIVLNEEQRQLNLKQIACCVASRKGNCESEQSLQDQISLYKQHYEMLLEEAESEKVDLRKKLKRQQDLVLDKDIKIKELSMKLNTSNSLATGNI